MTPAERLRMLQQQSQFFGGEGPVLVGGAVEDDAGPAIPGAPEQSSRTQPQRNARAVIGGGPGDADYEQAKQTAERNARGAARRQGFNEDLALDRGEAQRRGAAAAAASVQTAPVSPLTPDEPAPARDALTPSEATALQKKYENSGHTQNMTFDEWYDANFSGAAPEDVRRSAVATPRIQAGRDPNLNPGEASATAKSRQAAGKPLPEGRDISQYTPEQRRTMQRNIHSPEVPMQAFGGTFTQNVDGSVSSRAPNKEMIDAAAAIAADPEQGAGSASHTMALAQAYGIDATQYGDDMDLLKADVAREAQRHERLAKSYDVVDNGMGGLRYKYNPQKAQAALAERDLAMSPQRKMQFAREIYARHKGLMAEDGTPFVSFDELMALANTPEGFAHLRTLNQAANAMAEGNRFQNVRNNWANRNMTIAANNPRVAQGLYMRSLQEAARTGDPLQVAAVHESFGNERAAADYRNLAGIQSQVAGQALTAEANARASEEEVAQDTTLPKALSEQLSDALAIADPVQREIAIKLVLAKSGYPSDQIDAVTRQIVQSASGGAPAPTQSLWQWLFGGGGQQQPQQQAATPTAPTAAPAAVPPSGRGAMLNWATSGGPPAPDPNHPYRRGR